jgi:hypothetical protein
MVLICVPVIYGEEAHVDETDAVNGSQHSGIVREAIQNQDSAAVISGELAEERTNHTHADTLDIAETHSHSKLAVVRREHNFKRQSQLAIGMMVFVAIILGTSQTWNPR